MTDRVQFREDEEVVQFVESRGINPNDLAKRLFEAEVRRMRAEARLQEIRRRGIRLPRPAAEMVRDERESH